MQRAQYKRDLTLIQFASRDLVYMSCVVVFLGLIILSVLISVDYNNRNQPNISVRAAAVPTRPRSLVVTCHGDG